MTDIDALVALGKGITPGPWAVELCEASDAYHIAAGAWPYGTSVCEIAPAPRQGKSEANARAIAAVPTLFAALTALSDEIAVLKEREGQVADALPTNYELSHYSPMRCDDDDQATEWRVHSVNGGINDREWTLRGVGQTPTEAIRAALTDKAGS